MALPPSLKQGPRRARWRSGPAPQGPPGRTGPRLPTAPRVCSTRGRGRAALTEHLFAALRVRLVGVDPLEVGAARAVAHAAAGSAARSASRHSAPLHLSASPRAAGTRVRLGPGAGPLAGRGQVRPGRSEGAGPAGHLGRVAVAPQLPSRQLDVGLLARGPRESPEPQIVRGRPGALVAPHPAWLAPGRSSERGTRFLPTAQTHGRARYPCLGDEAGLARGQKARD